jgi:hypothetical protein
MQSHMRKVNSPLCLTKHCALKRKGSGCIDPRFLVLGINWSWVVTFTLRPLYPRERASGTHWIGVWMYPRVGVDDTEEWTFLTLPGLKLWPLCRPALSQSLYRLRYRGFHAFTYTLTNLKLLLNLSDVSSVEGRECNLPKMLYMIADMGSLW